MNVKMTPLSRVLNWRSVFSGDWVQHKMFLFHFFVFLQNKKSIRCIITSSAISGNDPETWSTGSKCFMNPAELMTQTCVITGENEQTINYVWHDGRSDCACWAVSGRLFLTNRICGLRSWGSGKEQTASG